METIPVNPEAITIDASSIVSQGLGDHGPLHESLEKARPAGTGPRPSPVQGVTTALEACKQLEGRLATWGGEMGFVQNCRFRPVLDAELFNMLVISGKSVVEMPRKVYAILPRGGVMTPKEAEALAGKRAASQPEDPCRGLEGAFVTADGLAVYAVRRAGATCKKLPLRNPGSVAASPSTVGQIVRSVSPGELQAMPTGPAATIASSKDSEIFYPLVGSSAWGRLGQGGAQRGQDSAKSVQTLAQSMTTKASRETICGQFKGRVVMFYSQSYYLDHTCTLRKADFSIELQQAAQKRGGPVDFTAEQMACLRQGSPIPWKELQAILER